MRVLIIGLGSIAHKHMNALREIDSACEIFALRSKKEVVEEAGITHLYDWTELSSYHFDFAIISNPTYAHKVALEQLSHTSMPLFIEKPLYHTLDIEDTVHSIVSNQNLTYIACNLRFLESIRYMKENLDPSTVNEVNVYCGSYLPDWRKGVDYRTVYSAIPEMGGGVHIDLIHEIDYIYWLFGEPQKVRRTFSNKSSLHIDAYDYANYCLSYPQFNVNIILNYYRRDPKRELEIVSSEHTYKVDLLKNSILKNQDLIYSSPHTILDTYKNQLIYFLACIKNNETTFNTITDAYNILKISLGHDTER